MVVSSTSTVVPLSGDAHAHQPDGEPITPSSTLPTVQAKAHKLKLLTLWLIMFCWNLASPLKCWILGRYEIARTEVSFRKSLEWTDRLDYGFVRFLYDHAGVPCDVPADQPTRLINVYIDLMVLPKALHWASGINAWHQDPVIGRYCQSGLVAKRDQQRQQLEALANKTILLWQQPVTQYIPDQTNCRVNEVPEAILCLKGYNASNLLNLEWSANVDVSDPQVDAALHAWQHKLLPDLNTCLARRKQLIEHKPQDQAVSDVMLQLASELAVNFSLDPHGWAGKTNLMALYTEERGFVDLSGKRAGMRAMAIAGKITERNRNNLDGDANALTAIRERLWDCIYGTRAYESFQACLEDQTLAQSAFFLGNQLMKTAEQLGTRYLDDNTLVQTNKTLGNRTEFNYQPVQEYLPVMYLTKGSMTEVESKYRDLVDGALFNETIAEERQRVNGVPDDLNNTALYYKCIYEPGCAETCRNITDKTSNFYFFYAIRRSEYCYLRRMNPENFNRDGFVSRECYGIGKGHYTMVLRFIKVDPVTHEWATQPSGFLEVPNVMDPMAMLACIIGGRLPSPQDAPFPTEFEDMINLGTGMVLTEIYGFGSERVLLNMAALASLLGCSYYGLLVLTEGYGVMRTVHRANKCALTGHHDTVLVLRSLSYMSLSSRIWRLHYAKIVPLSLLMIFQWHIGASRTMCSWFINDTNLLATSVALYPSDQDVVNNTPGTTTVWNSPEYRCYGGDALGHVRSLGELFRLLTYCFYVGYVLGNKSHQAAGMNRFMAVRMLNIVLLMVLPALVFPVLVTALNVLRLDNQSLALVHNQVFVMMLWSCLLLVGNRLMHTYYDLMLAGLALWGFESRAIPRGCLVRKYIKHFLVHASERQLMDELHQHHQSKPPLPPPPEQPTLQLKPLQRNQPLDEQQQDEEEDHEAQQIVWIPLSVLLETLPLSKLHRINFMTKSLEPSTKAKDGVGPSHGHRASVSTLQSNLLMDRLFGRRGSATASGAAAAAAASCPPPLSPGRHSSRSWPGSVDVHECMIRCVVESSSHLAKGPRLTQHHGNNLSGSQRLAVR